MWRFDLLNRGSFLPLERSKAKVEKLIESWNKVLGLLRIAVFFFTFPAFSCESELIIVKFMYDLSKIPAIHWFYAKLNYVNFDSI